MGCSFCLLLSHNITFYFIWFSINIYWNVKFFMTFLKNHFFHKIIYLFSNKINGLSDF